MSAGNPVVASALSDLLVLDSPDEIFSLDPDDLHAVPAADPMKPFKPDHDHAQFRSLVQNISDIITVLSTDGAIKYESPSVWRTLGYTPEELIGRNAFEFVHPEDIPALQTAFLACVAKPGQTVSPEFRFRHARGSWVYLEAIGNNLLDDPNVRGLVVTSRDVTARHELETQLRHAQKMEAIGQLAGGIAHDFNNMLMIIRGYAELMLAHAEAKPQMRANAEKILKTSDRASALTERLLAFSRKHTFAPRAVAVDALARESTTILQRLLRSDIELEVISPAETWHVLADQGELDQVIMNLTMNARDAMPNGGILTVETGNVKVEVPEHHAHVSIPAGNYVVLRVSDTGDGMDEETQARIFEPFFTTKEHGTGLGLSIVHSIVKQCHGCVLVSSARGKGTTFKVYLPALTNSVKKPAQEKRNVEMRPGGQTILVVDDEEHVRDVVQEYLEGKGYTVLTATDGVNALQKAERYSGSIDLLLTDVIMPRMRGPELATKVADLRSNIKIAYMSGYSENPELQENELAEGKGYLRKPFQFSELSNTLQKLLTDSSKKA